MIVCTPAYAAAALLATSIATSSRLLSAIEYTPIAVVGLGYRAAQSAAPPAAARHDGFGVLTTTASRAPILGVVWESNVFPGRAPPGQRCVRVMIGGQRNPELVEQDDAGLIATARAGLERWRARILIPTPCSCSAGRAAYPATVAGTSRGSPRSTRGSRSGRVCISTATPTAGWR